MAEKNQTARLLQVLLWYDEPQIVLLQPKPHEFIVGVAVEYKNYHSAFIGAHVTARQLIEYKIQKIDLRYLYLHPDLRKWWVFDLNNDSESIILRRISGKDKRVDEFAPESGFFSRDHDEIEIVDVKFSDSTQRFDIDGSWDLGEFSQFYGQVEDIYYLFHCVSEHQDVSTTKNRRKSIEEALVRPFRGGGSYVGLYNDFANDNDRAARLRVSGIQYHSPGYVEVKALVDPFEKTIFLINCYSENKEKIKKSYRDLYKILSSNNLLKKNSKIFGKELRNDVIERCDNLDLLLPGISISDLMDMTNEDILISSKVMLSLVRRVERLYQFFDEGRVKHPDIYIG